MSVTSNHSDAVFMIAARRTARLSGDPRTQVGCVLTHPNLGVISEAANDFPRGLVMNEHPSRLISPEKYKWIEHAERRAIYRAARTGVMTEGATLYVHGGFPCAECARAIVEAGIRRVVYSLGEASTSHWEDSYHVSRQILTEAGVCFDNA